MKGKMLVGVKRIVMNEYANRPLIWQDSVRPGYGCVNGIFINILSFSLPLFSYFLDFCFNFCFSFFYFFLTRHYLLEVDGVVDEAAVPLNHSLQFLVFAILIVLSAADVFVVAWPLAAVLAVWSPSY